MKVFEAIKNSDITIPFPQREIKITNINKEL